ncbi:hypothetical protein BSL78_07882 [Apostichopus japonicus]|uniref:Uncharacterized protein n=1 Tax=Stichopus japonicus TaxID=307972 RepID=A0A2G8L4I4_STIJA|nr:hypothetical protein BSL78_07882 [Apostichopus japonicus]
MALSVNEGFTEHTFYCSFKLSPDGELRLPARATFLGDANSFSEGYQTEEPLAISLLELDYGSIMTAYNLMISGSDMVLNPGSTLNLQGGGYRPREGPGAGIVDADTGTGAGYGGFGGSSSGITAGYPYGNYTAALDAGSGGGQGSSGVPGRGGGLLNIKMNGGLLIDGGREFIFTSFKFLNRFHICRWCIWQWIFGGGSGGGIYIEATGLDGHGTISSNGGDGLDQGGAGAGGRISIHLLQSYTFDGDIQSYGGHTTIPDIATVDGAAGTVYVREEISSFPKETLRIDGQRTSDLPTLARTAVEPTEGNSNLLVDKLYLSGYSILEVLGTSTTINFGRVFGDGTGTLIPQEGQTLLFETDLPTTSLCVLECSIESDDTATVVFPPYLAIDHNAHLSVRGKLDARQSTSRKEAPSNFSRPLNAFN